MRDSGQWYVHLPLDQPVTAIGGHYVLVKEQRLPFRGRELLYVVGHAVVDTSCCGVTGFAYARVVGFVVDWQSSTGADGAPVSQVEPLRDQALQQEVSRLIRQREVVQQVLFD